MRTQDRLDIAEFGPYIIEAVYFLRNDLLDPYDKPPEVEKIELHVHTKEQRDVKIIRLLDIPGWLWELLNDPKTLLQISPNPREEPASAGETDA